MTTTDELTPRERRVLEAVIQTYVQTAEPAGSRVLARRFGLGVSPATVEREWVLAKAWLFRRLSAST